MDENEEEEKEQVRKLKNQLKKNKKVAEAFAKVAAKLGPALPWILLAIVILIVLIGIIGFFMTMPGMLTGKIKEFMQGIIDGIESLYESGVEAKVNSEQIKDSAEYIESMGYDLIGYGFVGALNFKKYVAEKRLDFSNVKIDTKDVTVDDAGNIKIGGESVEEAGFEITDYGLVYKVERR